VSSVRGGRSVCHDAWGRDHRHGRPGRSGSRLRRLAEEPRGAAPVDDDADDFLIQPPGGIPTRSGLVKESVQQLGVSSSQFQAAQSACQHLLPGGGRSESPAQVQYVRALSLHFAQCVRSHGVPGFPDPGSDGRKPDPATVGINQGSPKFEAANQACRKYRPPYMPSNTAYNAYARAHGG
jgi:hypothetical protein